MPRRARRDGVNKSQLVREQLTMNPKIKVSEIVEALGQKGVKIQPSLVYFLRSEMRRKARKRARLHAVQSGVRAGIPNAAELVMKVKMLAREAGGLTNLKHLVDALLE
jgi:hypothetical protein